MMNIIKKIKEKESNIQTAKPVTIAFLGDSVTQGCFELVFDKINEEFEPIYDYELVYHRQFGKMLNALFPKVPIQIINAGVSGSTAKGGLERISNDVIRFNPDLIVVCFGLNDFVKGIEKLSEYAESLGGIFRTLQSIDSEIIFMTPNSCPSRITKKLNPYCDEWVKSIEKNVKNKTMDIYMDKAKEVCVKYGVSICDCYGKWKKFEAAEVDLTVLLSNSLNHPTREMHKLFAASLIETIFE